MLKIHRDAIQRNFGSLVAQTDLDLMVHMLYEKGVFSERMIEKYKDPNKDRYKRAREFYMDVMTRGPEAFGHLIDALQEAGYWNLARDLDPISPLHPRNPHDTLPRHLPQPQPSGENFISIRTKNQNKTRNKTDLETQQNNSAIEEPVQRIPESPPYDGELDNYIPHFDVIKSTKFYDEVDAKGIKPYLVRGKRGKRGVLVVFSYVEFKHGIEEQRHGADVDAQNLRYLFDELGFKVCLYLNLSKHETEEILKQMHQVLADAECVFIVVSSHGYKRGTSDVDFRCHDGGLLSMSEMLEYFSNERLPKLVGIPKVFIFQMCRGHNQLPLPSYMGSHSDGTLAPGSDGDAPVAIAPIPSDQPAKIARTNMRQYSDMLLAYSTLPGYVSRRDTRRGSWYIQVLCEQFAAHAHDTHVEKLLRLVDIKLEERFRVQTSTVDNWGFNRRLYLHPGLYDA